MKLSRATPTLVFCLLLGCSPEPPSSSVATTSPAMPVATLPVTYNDVMVALVNEAADPLWRAGWDSPTSEAEWRQLERRAYQLRLAGALLSWPGAGPVDATWAADPAWRSWAQQLGQAGNLALSAVRSRRIEDISAAGDTIVAVCEGCHAEFKLTMPTGGKYGETSAIQTFLQENP